MDYTQITAIVLAALGLAQTIARITPTPKDDKIVSVVGKFFNFIFLKSTEK